MSVRVRRIADNEALQLREIRLAALADAPHAFARTHAEEAARSYSFWFDRVRSNAAGVTGATFIAELGTRWVGLVGAYRASADEGCLELVSMWVAPTGRRIGAGRVLVSAVLDWASDVGASAVELWVTEGNEPAIRLYEAAGFAADDTFQPLPSDPCKNELRMRLVLDSVPEN